MQGRRVPLEELPSWSPWPARLLGLSEWSAPLRDMAKIEAEWNEDKYASCLRFFEEQGGAGGPEEIREFESAAPTALESATDAAACVSSAGELFEIPRSQLRVAAEALLVEEIEPTLAGAASVVELGCGYGYHLWRLAERYPQLEYRGGDFSANAVELARRLYEGRDNLKVTVMDFHDERYEPVEDATGPVVLFTWHALEQLQSATNFFAVVRRYADKIAAVLHFEPLYEAYDNSLLGLMRRAYMRANDYNPRLLSTAKSAEDVQIRSVVVDSFGANPLHPTSVLEWRFAGEGAGG